MEEQITNKLPKNWVETDLGNLLYLKNGYSFKSGKYVDKGNAIIRISDIQEGSVTTRKSVFVEKDEIYDNFIIEKGDVLIAMSGATTGKYGFFIEDTIAYQNQRVGNLKPYSEKLFSKEMVFYLLGAYKKEIFEKAYGGAQPNISTKLIESLRVNLPPLLEQERIVVKLEALFGSLEQLNAGLDKIPSLLKNFKQAVLTQAVTGKLTEEWRVGKELDAWEEVLLKNHTTKIGSGSTPRGGSESYKSEGIPLVRSMNIHFNGIKNKGLAFIDEVQAEKLKNVIIEKNDVLLNITGASIGRVCLAEDSIIGGRVNQHVSIIRSNDSISPLYLNMYLASEIIQNFIHVENYGVTRQALTKTQTENLIINKPSLIEQTEIVNRVESLFARAEALEARYHALKEKVAQLPQAILAKAFKGELVPQLESDGDAKELLKEILELKAATATASRASASAKKKKAPVSARKKKASSASASERKKANYQTKPATESLNKVAENSTEYKKK